MAVNTNDIFPQGEYKHLACCLGCEWTVLELYGIHIVIFQGANTSTAVVRFAHKVCGVSCAKT